MECTFPMCETHKKAVLKPGGSQEGIREKVIRLRCHNKFLWWGTKRPCGMEGKKEEKRFFAHEQRWAAPGVLHQYDRVMGGASQERGGGQVIRGFVNHSREPGSHAVGQIFSKWTLETTSFRILYGRRISLFTNGASQDPPGSVDACSVETNLCNLFF